MLESGQRTELNGRGKMLERSKRATGMKPGGNNDCGFYSVALEQGTSELGIFPGALAIGLQLNP